MSNLEIALKLAKQEIKEGTALRKAEDVKNYSEFIEDVYDGDSKQFKEDLEYTFNQYNNESEENNLEFTDDVEIIEGTEIITYRKFINILKKEVWG